MNFVPAAAVGKLESNPGGAPFRGMAVVCFSTTIRDFQEANSSISIVLKRKSQSKNIDFKKRKKLLNSFIKILVQTVHDDVEHLQKALNQLKLCSNVQQIDFYFKSFALYCI
eukprot:TRINITY_DN2017_c0_g1_i1.p2 TRINITY_DN2017_c0_g1~~TRINITY_DN2017_c0_g1_i1.p2  ORF type:complete len:112 (-),score=2.85 TRINITY_DN2017_c0_g1_i1:484-819(-)